MSQWAYGDQYGQAEENIFGRASAALWLSHYGILNIE